MKSVFSTWSGWRAVCTTLALLFLLQPSRLWLGAAQTATAPTEVSTSERAAAGNGFRLERLPVAGGAELLTIFGEINGLATQPGDDRSLPLVSILRDTLGDAAPDNDQLRYVWTHTYTRPMASQRLASAVPFLYTRVGNKSRSGKSVPPPVIDLAAAERDVWQKLFWSALQSILLDPVSLTVKASTRTLRRNADDYRKAHLIRALAILALYEAETNAQNSIFTPSELQEIQARLMLAQKTFGGLIDDIYLQRVYQKHTAQWLDTRGHNWELLRQRAESEGLYFEPLELPDGSATHVLLWTTRADVESQRERKFNSRFLNIKSPWRDKRLRRWQGYTETRHFDAESRRVAPQTPGATEQEMIPVALYGLEHPKIPILLVDFRDAMNPKNREITGRVLQDVAGTLLSLSRFQLPYFLGRATYDFITDRRGMDINQPTRLRAYSQLKLLLSLNASLDPQLREELSRRLERAAPNPLENDLEVEVKIAREQYAALKEYAMRADGLPRQLDRDRRAELVPLKHNRAEQVLLRLAHTLSFGRYTHREKAALPEQVAALDLARRFAHHRQFLREVAKHSARVEVQWDIEEVRRSLQFIAAHGQRADAKTAAAAARIFANTHDEDIKRLCLDSLYRINNETAKSALLRIYRDDQLEARWRNLSANYLRMAAREAQRIAPADAKVIATIQ
ncbi:MAG: hypothetical protein M3371_05415 [Acidobacteriota bacterium]|nr:hypothetical protein [Acidobacteriota bacterium]